MDAYATYVGRVRSCIYAAVLLYRLEQSSEANDRRRSALVLELTKADSRRVLAFERVMLLADESVIAVAHAVNEALAVIDWTARGIRTYSVRLDERGHVITDDHLATTAPGVYAAGDV